MTDIRLVLFDVDGVLLDSLAQHLKICEDKNREYGLGLRIPSVPEFRKIALDGIKISPMEDFFRAVGFPPEFAQKADAQYREVFVRDYPVNVFPGVSEMLRELLAHGIALGIVTSNVRENIKRALGPNMFLFRTDCVVTKSDAEHTSKADAIKLVLSRSMFQADQTMYIGDQLSDLHAARSAGVKFLGAVYGWGIKPDGSFPIVHNVTEIRNHVLTDSNCTGDIPRVALG